MSLIASVRKFLRKKQGNFSQNITTELLFIKAKQTCIPCPLKAGIL